MLLNQNFNLHLNKEFIKTNGGLKRHFILLAGALVMDERIARLRAHQKNIVLSEPAQDRTDRG